MASDLHGERGEVANVSPHIVARMLAFVRKFEHLPNHPYSTEARQIIAALDPDKAIVDAVLADLFPEAADPNEWAMRRVAMECIRRARLAHLKSNGGE